MHCARHRKKCRISQVADVETLRNGRNGVMNLASAFETIHKKRQTDYMYVLIIGILLLLFHRLNLDAGRQFVAAHHYIM